ncbi:hypothetical protein [Lactiplantibacillus plantarum]|uniref:hypothetical protein n=1 Tax=Lactiplantibacillus plantarum TaxID=1590 RepID=UPI000481C0CC|nr:hypothetical protein [Lactiplantibacillus plantarum]PCE78872.1 hypothetical protein CJP43_15265 [Lactiplantibacillus plantarum]
MDKLIYGKKKQVVFRSVNEKQLAFDYLKDPNNTNVKFGHEENQKQGAWGPEDRIMFKTLDGVPDCLKRNMTAGNSAYVGRINCKELIDAL